MRLGLILILALSLFGCGGGDPTSATVVQVNVTASPRVNPDGNGRPSPIVVKVYFLKNPGAFEAADFFALFQKEGSVLGDTLVLVQEMRLLPGMRQAFIQEVDAAGWIGVAAAFRDLDHALWRQTIAIPRHQTSLVKVELEPLAVRLDLIQHR